MRRWFIFIAALGLFGWPREAHASFSCQAVLTVSSNATYMPAVTLTDYPVPVITQRNCLKSTGNGGSVTDAQGDDIVVKATSCAGSTQSYELVYWSASSGDVALRISQTIAQGTVLYLCIGDGTITTFQGGSSGAAWNAAFLAAYHFGDGATLSVNDSTTNADNLTNNNTATATTGKLAGGVALASASSQSLSESGWNADYTVAASYSAWVKFTSFPNAYTTVVSQTSAGRYVQLHVKDTGKLALYLKATNNVSYDGTGSNTLSTGTWYHIGLTYDTSAGLVGYVNGASDGTASADGDISTGAGPTLSLGDDPSNTPRFVNGVMDEVMISNTVRTANWMKVDYTSINDNDNFIAKSWTDPSAATCVGGGMLKGFAGC